MKIIICKDDGTVFSTYTKDDVRDSLQDEIDYSEAAVELSEKDVLDELVNWVEVDIRKLEYLNS